MSKILVKGDINKKLEESNLYFLCIECGQEWIANKTEYKSKFDYPYTIHSMECKCCGNVCYGKKTIPEIYKKV